VFGGIGAGGLLSVLAALALADSGGFRVLFLGGALAPIVLVPAIVAMAAPAGRVLEICDNTGARHHLAAAAGA
jgi:hypothetical protein